MVKGLSKISIDIDKAILNNINKVILKNIDIDKEILENIDIDKNIDKAILKNIDIDIDKMFLRNIDKENLKISISTRPFL